MSTSSDSDAPTNAYKRRLLNCRLNNSETIRFLQLYRNEKLLYDSSVPEYHDRRLRKKAIKRIADAMNIPGFAPRHVPYKYCILRCMYVKEARRRAAAVSFHKERPFYPRLRWFSVIDEFLRPHIQHLRTEAVYCSSAQYGEDSAM